MRIPFTLCSFLLPASVFASQVTWWTPSTSSKTIIDALNADPDYEALLLLLQRAKLIPTLNQLDQCTLFAPTNDAIKKHTHKNALWRSVLNNPDGFIPDNVQEELRQQLFYHILNKTITVLPNEGDVRVLQTMLFPRKPHEPPSREPPPYPPWMPIPGGTLGGAPQRLRVGAQKDLANVGVDAFGGGGTKIVKGLQDAGNGALLGIDEVLEPPPDLATLVSQHASTSYFRRVITPTILQRLNTTPELTLFIPVDQAWDSLDKIERLYLESEFALEDLSRILDMHAVVEDHVTWSEAFEPGVNLTTLHGTTLNIEKTSEGITVRDAKIIQPDIYASNGVLHLVDSLLVPEGALQLTPEKYLLALNCTKFVSLLHSVELTSFINNTDAEYTILAANDDILSVFGDPEIPKRGSEELRKLLQYHFIPGKWSPSKLKNGTLLETALQEPGLSGGRQVLSIEVHSEGKKNKEDRTIRFGGAGMIADPVEVNNTLIYFISRPLQPPPDPFQAALPSLDLSSFLAAIFSTSKSDYLRIAPSTTFLLPHNEAFKRLGLLVSAHLLAPSSKEDLENVIFHHALNTVEYAHSLVNGTQHSFATLEGSDLKVDRLKNGTVILSSSGGWSDLNAELYTRDLLTQTGVIHELSDILIPRSVQLTIGKLVKAAKGSTMATLLSKAGFEWVLNGTAPPEGSPWGDEQYGAAGWTLLCPPDDAFKGYNLTELYSDLPRAKDIVEQHLIPTPSSKPSSIEDEVTRDKNNNRPLVLDDSTYSTIRSVASAYGDIVFQRKAETKDYVVGIKGARGTNGEDDWATVLAWGRSTITGSGGVIQINRLLLPYEPSWWTKYGPPSIVGALGIVGICGFFYGVRLLWNRDATEATYEPVGGFGRDDDDDS